jgi:hypothetical protein
MPRSLANVSILRVTLLQLRVNHSLVHFMPQASGLFRPLSTSSSDVQRPFSRLGNMSEYVRICFGILPSDIRCECPHQLLFAVIMYVFIYLIATVIIYLPLT